MKCSFLSERQLLFARAKNKKYTPRSSDMQKNCKSKTPRLCPLCPRPPKHEMPEAGRLEMKGLHAKKQAKKIAETIILQAIKDLWSALHRQESIKFFTGEGFAICSRIAGMGMYEKLKLIQTIKKAIKNKNHTYAKQSLKQAWG